MDQDRNIALILSGGTGTRLGLDIPKQYIEVEGRPVISYCMESLFLHEAIDGIQIVADPFWQEPILGWIAWLEEKLQVKGAKFKGFSLPGESRQLSIFHGLEDIRAYVGDTGYVFIHDGARPVLSARQITDCLRAAKGRGGVMPSLPMKDTVYSSLDGKSVAALLDRKTIYAGQAPEVFQIGPYYEANRRLLPDRILAINGSTEPAIMAGMDIAMIPGDEDNFKITTKADLARFRKIMAEKKANTL